MWCYIQHSTPNYRAYYTQHPDVTSHAGSAVSIKSNLRHQDLTKYDAIRLRVTTVLVKVVPFDIAVSPVYCRYDTVKSDQFLAFFNSIGSRFLFGMRSCDQD